MATHMMGGLNGNHIQFHQPKESKNESRLKDIWVSLLNLRVVTGVHHEDEFTGGDLLLESTAGFFYKMKDKYKAIEASYETTKTQLQIVQKDFEEVSLQLMQYMNTPCSRCADLGNELARKERKLRQNDQRMKSIASILMGGGVRPTQDSPEDEPAMARICTMLTQMLQAPEEEPPAPERVAACLETPRRRRGDLACHRAGKTRGNSPPQGRGIAQRGSVCPPVEAGDDRGPSGNVRSRNSHEESPSFLGMTSRKHPAAPKGSSNASSGKCSEPGVSGVEEIPDSVLLVDLEEQPHLVQDRIIIPETLESLQEPGDSEVTMMPGSPRQNVRCRPTLPRTPTRRGARRDSSDTENSEDLPNKRRTEAILKSKSSEVRLSNSPSLLPHGRPPGGWKLPKTSQVLPKAKGMKRLRQTKLSLGRAPCSPQPLRAVDRPCSESFTQFLGAVGPTSTEVVDEEEDVVPDSPEKLPFRISSLPKAQATKDPPGKRERVPFGVLGAKERANEYNRVPRAGEKSPDFKYRREAVRGRAQRQQLEGWDCSELLRGGGGRAERLAAEREDEPLLAAPGQVRPAEHPSRFLESSHSRHRVTVAGGPKRGKSNLRVSSVPRVGYTALETLKVCRSSRSRPPERSGGQRHSM